MKRPPILLILALTGMWLLLNGTLAFGQLLLGLGVSTLMVLGFRVVRPVQPTLRRPLRALLLLWRVFVDILRSNVAVARIVLGLNGKRTLRSGFLDVPLDMRDPNGLAALATIVTSTPGTVWVDLSPDGATLTLHVLDLRDEQAWIDTIKQRYERLLMEIFE
ncbi:MAG TPA: Na+/H+ antiporter subunit E [Steroidobacteraceae bacterium]|nr:Na+/H+ antiporter subunit E [Steroidobacteraceae bacterium]